MQNIRVDAVNGQYDIKIGSGELKKLASYLAPFHKVLIVTDENVFSHYEQVIKNYPVLVVPAGEHSKSHEILLKIYDELLQSGMTRADAVVAFGGGVVGDLAGFAAASFKRGMQFVQIQTTLLAQVDSSVGGKVGVNLPGGKNMVGAFYQPDLVVADMDTLDTLPPREVAAGMAEIIKYGYIADKILYSRLKEQKASREEMVYTCCSIKAGYVKKDPFDLGVRMQLNYGHTMGHAIETVSGYGKYLHGEAVAIGMCLAARIGERLGISPKGLAEGTQELVELYGLPSQTDEQTLKDACDVLMRDKKVKDGNIQFVLIDKIGHAVLENLKPEGIAGLIL